MSDLRWEHYAEQRREEMLNEIYDEMPKLYDGNNYDEILDNVLKYVNAEYGEWERFISREDILVIINEYTARLV